MLFLSNQNLMLKNTNHFSLCVTFFLHYFYFRHLCDGTWQCPDGDDEYECKQHSCSGLFYCSMEKNVMICLHLIEVCDGVNDCKSGEDEFLCDDLPHRCPASCNCLLYGMLCSNTSIELLGNTKRAKFVFLNFVGVFAQNIVPFHLLYSSSTVSVLIWSKSRLVKVCSLFIAVYSVLRLADFSLNLIKQIPKHCFANFVNLLVLSLAGNLIQIVEHGTFLSMVMLMKLDLSDNRLVYFHPSLVHGPGITHANIRQNPFHGFDICPKCFLSIKVVLTDDFRICCVLHLSDATCSGTAEWPQSCNSVLYTTSLQVAAFFVLALEIIVIISALMSLAQESKQYFGGKQSVGATRQTKGASGYSWVVWLLTINEFLNFAHLFVLVLSNYRHAHNFAGHLFNWLESLLCKVLGMITLVWLLNSLYLLNLISISRYFVVRHPFSQHFKRKKITIRYLCIGLINNGAIGLAALIFYQFVEKHERMPFPTCMFLGETTFSTTVRIASTMLAVLEIISSISVTGLSCLTIHELKGDGQAATPINKDQTLPKMMLLLPVLHSLCWIPSGFVLLYSTQKEYFPTDLLIWNTVLITPLNSIISLFVYILIPKIKHTGTIK